MKWPPSRRTRGTHRALSAAATLALIAGGAATVAAPTARADSNGIDTDIATTASVVQYNYIHNNGEGYLACACQSVGFGDAIFRYNVLASNSPTVPSGDAHHIVGDPRFANPTAGGTGTQAGGPDLSAGLNWRISASSPAVRAGVSVANNGGVDYMGVTIPAVPDVGALQHS